MCVCTLLSPHPVSFSLSLPPSPLLSTNWSVSFCGCHLTERTHLRARRAAALCPVLPLNLLVINFNSVFIFSAQVLKMSTFWPRLLTAQQHFTTLWRTTTCRSLSFWCHKEVESSKQNHIVTHINTHHTTKHKHTQRRTQTNRSKERMKGRKEGRKEGRTNTQLNLVTMITL